MGRSMHNTSPWRRSPSHPTVTFDISCEPIMLHALSQVVVCLLSTDRLWKEHLDSLLPEMVRSDGHKGMVAEDIIALELSRRVCKALRVLLMSEDGSFCVSSSGFMGLPTLLQPWLPLAGTADSVDGFGTRACRLRSVGASQEASGEEMLAFVRDDGTYDDEVILTDLPQKMGADLMFLASYATACASERKYSVVAVQLRNRNTTHLW
jgi:hypothetical protein